MAVPGTMPNLFHTFSHLLLIMTLKVWSYHCPHLTAEQTEAQRLNNTLKELRNDKWWSQVSSQGTDTFAQSFSGDSALCPSSDPTIGIGQSECSASGPCIASSPASSLLPAAEGNRGSTALSQRPFGSHVVSCRPNLELHSRSLRGCGHLSISLRTSTFLSQNSPYSTYKKHLG